MNDVRGRPPAERERPLARGRLHRRLALRLPSALLAFIIAILAANAAGATIITVSGDGSADFLTIQEAIEAALPNALILVFPGTYTDLHEVILPGHGDLLVNAHIWKPVSVAGMQGPDVTFVDGGGQATAGIVVSYAGASVTGLTVQNGSGDLGSTGIVVAAGEASGNVCSGYRTGLSVISLPAAEAADPPDRRGRGADILNNKVEWSDCGIRVEADSPGGPTTISGNLLHRNDFGIVVTAGEGEFSIVGNDVLFNRRGVVLRCESPLRRAREPLDVTLGYNLIQSNSVANIEISAAAGFESHVFDVTIGGAVEAANNVLSSVVNLSAVSAAGVTLTIDAPYNFWGDTVCAVFEPKFQIDAGIPEENFVFEPFVNEDHSTVYPECEAPVVDPRSWGGIKGLYR
jgi:hypothetical protein